MNDLEKFEKAKPLIDEALTLISTAQVLFYVGEEQHKQGKAEHERIQALLKAKGGDQ